MKGRLPAILAGCFGLFLSFSLFSVAAQEIESEFEAVERIVAIGDVHGAYENFVETLTLTGLIDEDLNWVGGGTHVVQTGDVLDRGPDSRKAVDLLMALETEAQAAGGRVHALVGNHEFWNAVGDMRYVSRAELAAFEGNRDRQLRKEMGVEAAPEGALAHREAFGPQGEYGKWIRRHNAVIRIGEVVFAHGGVTPEVAELGLPEINRRVRGDMDSANWLESFSMQEDGPLLTRRYSDENLTEEEEAARLPEVQRVLQALGARLMVVGHTVTFGLIEPRFDGRVLVIDTGMLDVYLGGRRAALIIEGERIYAAHPGGRVEIPKSLRDDSGVRYIELAIEYSEGDAALKRRLAGVRLREGRLREAAELYESVGVLDPRQQLPYAWRKEAAECFRSLGEDRQAERLYDLYLQGFRTTAQRMGPSGIPLLHSYARDALRLGLQIDEAFEAASQATAAYPKNPSFKVTLAWGWLAKGDPARAVRVLSMVKRLGHDSFYAQLILGRAYLELDQRDEALEAFRAARAFEANHPEVEENIAKLSRESK